MIIGFGHEMNGPWYPWGYRHVAPSTFVAAWRHVVTVFRGQGADNVTWLWTINQDLSNTGPVSSWWPGNSYVTWVGIDGYYYRPSDTFAHVFGRTIDQVRAFTSKPVLLSETAVGPGGRPVRQDQRLVRGAAQYQTLGTGVVRHGTAQRDLPSGLAHRNSPAAGRVPARGGQADLALSDNSCRTGDDSAASRGRRLGKFGETPYVRVRLNSSFSYAVFLSGGCRGGSVALPVLCVGC